MEEFIGIVAALGSVLLFGSYAVPIRFPHVIAAQIDPMIFQFYKSTACFASSWLLLLFVPLRFTWWGLAGGGLWVMTGVGAITAVQLAGIGTAQALWSGLSIFVSYIWGAFYFKEPIRNYWLSIFALAIMAIGMVGVGSAASGNNLLSSFAAKYQKSPPQSPHAVKARHEHQTLDSDLLTKTLILDHEGISAELPTPIGPEEPSSKYTHGILCAILVGVLNGSFMLPLKLANREVVGAKYIFSFGMGAMAITMLVLAAYSLVRFMAGKPSPKFQLRVAALPALTTGILWSMGNACSVYATLYLGISLGWPLVQCQILVSSLWAVFYYHEVVGRDCKAMLLGSSALVVCGVVLLSQFGTYTSLTSIFSSYILREVEQA